MLNKKLCTGMLALALILPARAICDKKPVAEDDFASMKVLQTMEIKLLLNDFAYDDHPFKLFLAYGNEYGSFVKTDSSIIYTPSVSTPGKFCTDTILYNIVDLENNLLSDFARVVIDITNDGFDQLEANEVSCRINAYGLQFWNMNPEILINYEVPAGSGTGTIFNQSLWIGGLDESGQLHMAAERYRQLGADFFSGPVMDSSAYCQEQDVQWHKVWKVTAQDIQYHLLHWKDPGYEPVENIARWPGNGNTSLGQSLKLADYYDQDADGLYNPLNGDFPLIKGDQAILAMNNDDRAPHGESGGRKLGVEVHTLYYAFEAPEDSALKYTTFADQFIINRSGNAYHDVYIGHFLDYDLGYFLDDYLHCDTALKSAICYNGLPVDGQGTAGQYGEHPPAQSFTCLNYDMESFAYFLSWSGPPAMQDPAVDSEYYKYMRGLWKDSTSFTFGGNGYGGEMPVRYVFTGDPVSGNGWTELDSPLGPGDRRGLITSGPYILNPGDTIHLEFAFVYARDPVGDNISSLALLEERIEQVRNFYQNFQGISDKGEIASNFHIYPNPCRDYFFVSIEDAGKNISVEYSICDISGKPVKRGTLNRNGQSFINTEDLPAGFYLFKISSESSSHSTKLIKN